MNYYALEKNLIDVIKESQIKIGFTKNPVSIFYPLNALNNLFDTELDETEMLSALKGFSGFSRILGNTSCSFLKADGRFSITVPAENAEFIHENIEDNPFLAEFIDVIRKHGITADDVIAVFRKFSDNVVTEDINNDEFDMLVYFSDGIPDDYRYCLKFEFGHAIYHRFTPKDYAEFDF